MKPLPLATVAYPLTGGVDTKTHELMLPPPKLQVCENAYVDRTGSIQRRYGRALVEALDQDGVGFNSAVKALGSYKDRLLGYFPDTLYEYTAINGRWNYKGRTPSWKMGAEELGSEHSDPLNATATCLDMAIIGSGPSIHRCYVYDYSTRDSVGAVTTFTSYKITDGDGAIVKGPTLIQSVGFQRSSRCKVVAFGTRFYIFTWTFADAVTPVPILCTIYNTAIAGGAIVVGNPTLTASSAALFDVATSPALGPFFVYVTDVNSLEYGFVNTAGALTNAVTTIPVAIPTTLSCSVYVTTHGIAYSCGTTPSDVYALVRTFTAGAWAAVATSTAMDTALVSAVRQTACYMDGPNTLSVWYAGDLNVTRPCTRMGKFQPGVGVFPRIQLYPRVWMASRPAQAPASATNQPVVYWWAVSEGRDSSNVYLPTLYLYTEFGVVSAWANSDVTVFPSYTFERVMPHLAAGAGGTDTEYSLFTLYYTRLDFSVVQEGATTAMRRVSFETASTQGYVAVEDGRELYIPSGFLQQYDGEGVTEAGFLSVVDTAHRTPGTVSIGSGALDTALNNTYSYHVVQEWLNAQGEREQGTDMGSKTVGGIGFWPAGSNTVALKIDCVPWTLKRARTTAWQNLSRTNLVFAVYRTLKNPTAQSPFYRVGEIANNPLLDTVTFTDEMSDADAQLKEQFYLGTGEVDNVAAAPGHILAAGNGRVFVAGIPGRVNTVLYSKTREDGGALAFNETLTIQFPGAHGPITAMCVFNESLIVFTETAIYRVNGDGLSNLGTTGGYTNPVLVHSDAGAVGQRAVIVTPMGVMFESAKGKMLLKPSFTIEYIGAPVEKLMEGIGLCLGVVMIPALQQIRFTYAQTVHVYDYYHGQWYVFTQTSEGPPTLWNGGYVAIQDNVPAYDKSSVWTDAGDPYTVTLVLGWMHGSALLSDLAVRKIGLTGQVLGMCNLSVMIAHDQGPVSQTIDTTESILGPLSHEWRVSRQVCEQIEITIRDAFLDMYGLDVVQPTAGFCLNELTFEVALRSQVTGRNRP